MNVPLRNELQMLEGAAARSLGVGSDPGLSQVQFFLVFFCENKIWRRSQVFHFSEKQIKTIEKNCSYKSTILKLQEGLES